MLKKISDGLTKVWKSDRCHEPFYSGGKTEVISGETKLACIYDEDLRIVDFSTGEQLDRLSEDSDADTNEVVTCFCMHPNGDEVVVATQTFLLRHWKISEKNCLRVIKGHTMPVLCMAYDPTGTLIATGSADRAVRVWDVAKGYCTHNFREHTDIVRTVHFHPDPNRLQLFSCSDDNSVRIYDLIDSACVACFRDHMSLPTGISLTPDGYMLASAGRDKVLNFYELRSFKHLKTVPLMDELEGVIVLTAKHTHAILGQTAVKSKKSGYTESVVISAGSKGVIRILRISMTGKDTSSFQCISLAEISLSPTNAAAQSSNLPLMYAVRGLHYLVEKGEIVAVTSDHNFCFFKIQKAEGSEEGTLTTSKQICGCNDDILDILVIPPQDGESSTILSDDNTLSKSIVRGNMEDGQKRFKLALVTNSPQIRIVDENFTCSPLDGHTDIVLAADVSPDGRWLATSSKDRTCRVWDLWNHRCVAVGEGHADAVGAVCISQRHATYQSKIAFMISGAGDKILKRWPLTASIFVQTSVAGSESNEVLKLGVSHNVRGHDKDINTLAVSPNDAMAASGSQDKSIRLWRSSDLSPIATLTGHKRGIWKVAFSPVDRCLASCSGDRTVRLWSVVDYTCLRVFEGHTASVLTVKFANKGMQLLSGAADGLIRLWTIRSGECENTFDLHSDRVWAIAVGSASTTPGYDTEGFFFSGGSDSKLHVWHDATQSEETKRLDEAEKSLLADQQLQNDIRNKRYDKALAGALSLGYSNKVLNIYMAILDDDKEETKEPVKGKNSNIDLTSFSENVGDKLDPYTATYNDEDLEKIVNYLKEWNTNAKHSFVSQAVLSSLIRVVKTERLMANKSISESIPGLLAYSERHYSRVDRLHQSTYLLEYMSSLMRLLPLENCEVENPKKASKNQGSKVRTPVLENGEEPELVLFAPLPVEKSESAGKASKGKKRKA